MSRDLPDRPEPWWDLEPGDDKLASRLVNAVQDIERRQPGIWEGNRRHARSYAGYLPPALAWGVSPQSHQRVPFEATKGLVRSICDTATALIVRSRPKATFVTDGADWKVQQQAEDLDQFMVGAYETAGIYEVAPRAFHDSTVFGTGAWKYVPQGKGEDFKVKVERVLIDDLVVDEEECREHLIPENVYHRTMVRTEALVRKYAPSDSPEDRQLAYKIRGSVGNASWPARHVPAGRTVLVEAIRCPVEGSSDKPRRVVCVDGVVLEDAPWPYPWHPYTFLWWAMPISGFYGDGIAYRQYGRQQRITYLYRWIQRCHDLFATPRAWVDPAGGPPTLQMSNELGAIISARRPPSFQEQKIVPTEVYRWLDMLEHGGYEDEGISQVSAENRLPPGIESAPAQREYSFKEGQRFAPVSQRWEHAVAVDAAVKMTAMYRYHAEKSKTAPRMKWADRRLMHQIDWPDLEEDAYVIRAEASSLESLSPASRYQSALELAQTGWITPQEGRGLIGHPDLREAEELDNAPRNHAKMVLRQLWRGEAPQLDELADLQQTYEVIFKGRLLAIQRGAPQRIVDGMSRFLESLDMEKSKVQAAMLPPGGPSPAMAPSASPGGFPEPMKG